MKINTNNKIYKTYKICEINKKYTINRINKPIRQSLRFLASALVFFVTSIPPDSLTAGDPFFVLTTTTDLAYFASQIGGDRLRSEALIRGYNDPHFIEARPDFIVKASRADIFIEVGLDLEVGWSPVLLAQSRNDRIQKNAAGYCDASRGVIILERPAGRVDRSMGDIHVFGNPHYWMDPLNAAIVARNIRDAMIRVDPSGRNVYETNYQAFFERMRRLALEETRKFHRYEGLKVAVYHREFVYLINRFKLREIAAIEEKPGVPPSARYLRDTIEKLKSENVKVILLAPFNDPRYAKIVASEIGARVVILPVSVGSESGMDTYEKTISVALDRIRAAADETGGGR